MCFSDPPEKLPFSPWNGKDARLSSSATSVKLTFAEAASEAARQRFRAIMMTALTFIVGSLPLAFSTGAGAASRQEIGTVVVGGMIVASSLALFFVPLFFKLIEDFGDWRQSRKRSSSGA